MSTPAILVSLLSSQVCFASRSMEHKRREVAIAGAAAQGMRPVSSQQWPPMLELAQHVCEWVELYRVFVDTGMRPTLAGIGPMLGTRAPALEEFDRRFHSIGFLRLDRLINVGGCFLGDAFLSQDVRSRLRGMSGTLENKTFALRSALKEIDCPDAGALLDDLLSSSLEMFIMAGC